MKHPIIALLLAILASPAIVSAGEERPAARPEIPLRGVVLLREESLLPPDAAARMGGVDATRLGPWADPALSAVVKNFLGRPIAPRMFEELRASLSSFFRERFGLLTLITLPPQEATGGVIQVIVTPSRVGQVKVSGGRWFSESFYRHAMPAAAAGNILDLRAIRAEVDDVNTSAYRHVEMILAPGAGPGTTDLTFEARDRLPLRAFAGYADNGTRTTERERVSAGLEWANALGRGDTATYQYSGDPAGRRMRTHFGAYRARLPWNHAVSLSATTAIINAAIPDPFDQRGRSSSLSIRYEAPLPAWRGIAQELTFTSDYKRSDNNLLFAAIPITDNLTEILQAGLSYSASRPDTQGATNFAVAVVASPGGLAERNRTRYFRGSRFGARADYVYGTLDLSRVQRLPLGFSWRSALHGQVSSGNLLGSEQLGLGGAGSVRGFEEGEIYGDEGATMINELLLPAMRGLGRWREGWNDKLQPVAFVDYGWAHVHTPLEGEESDYQLWSAGVGVRYQVASVLTARLEYAWRIKEIGTALKPGGRLHANVSVAW